MPPPIEIRPMREGDALAAHEVGVAAFAELESRHGEWPGPAPDPQQAALRFQHLARSDAGGSWVAERSGQVVGCALAIMREGLWGLSSFAVRPEAQGTGVGRELLARAWAYGRAARGWVILSSTDPRAMRAYARLGLAMHPCVFCKGRPREVVMPDGVRAGSPEDLQLVETVSRAVRGAAHGADIEVFLEGGATLLVIPERGYAVVRGASPRLLAAVDDDAARDLLRAILARAAGEEAMVEWISAGQDWAMAVCLDAGLDIEARSGGIFMGGEVGPFRPYLPSGAYL